MDIGTDGSNPCKLTVGIDEVTKKEIELISEKMAEWEEHKKGLETLIDQLQIEVERLDMQTGKLTRGLEDARKQAVAFEKRIEELKSQDSPSQMAKVQEVAENLNSKIHQIGKALETLSKQKEQFAGNAAIHKEEIDRTDVEIEGLQERKDSLTEWSKKNPGVPAVTVSGTIYAQNVIDGPNSAIKLKKDERHVVIKETLVDQEEDGPKRWHFDIKFMD